MRFIRVSFLALSSSLFAFAAPVLSGDLTLNYENWSGTGVSGDSLTASVRNDFGLAPPFGLQGDLSYRNHDIGGASNDTLNGTLHGYWSIPSSNKVGVFLSYSDINATPSATFPSYGVEAIYNLAALNLEVWYGTGDVDTGTKTSVDFYGAEVVYPASPTFDIFARASVHDPAGSGNNATDYTVGVDWDTGGLGIVTATIGTADIAGSSADRLGIGFTIPIGGSSGSQRMQLFETGRSAYRY